MPLQFSTGPSKLFKFPELWSLYRPWVEPRRLGLGEGGIIHNGPVRFWVSVVVCPLDDRTGHFPIPCASDDGWGVSLNPSVVVIDEDRSRGKKKT